jgi:GT2 family glycosyltransferase
MTSVPGFPNLGPGVTVGQGVHRSADINGSGAGEGRAVILCEGKDMSESGAAIALSICICTFNRADDLAFALENLARLRVPQGRGVEFIIVDNASTDATPALLKAAAARFPFPFVVLREPARGSGAAHNCALRYARGEVVAWTDDDCVPAEDWIERILAHFDEDPALDLLTGRVELYDPSHYPITINTSLEPAILGLGISENFLILGCNLAFRRNLVERIGLYDPRFGAGAPLRAAEDTDFAFRALRKGCLLAYAPDVLLYHNHKRVTDDQVMRLRRNYVYGDGAMLMKHVLGGDSTGLRWFYWRCRSIVGRMVRPPPWLRSRTDSATLLMEFFAGALAYLGFALRRSRPGHDARNLTSAR